MSATSSSIGSQIGSHNPSEGPQITLKSKSTLLSLTELQDLAEYFTHYFNHQNSNKILQNAAVTLPLPPPPPPAPPQQPIKLEEAPTSQEELPPLERELPPFPSSSSSSSSYSSFSQAHYVYLVHIKNLLLLNMLPRETN